MKTYNTDVSREEVAALLNYDPQTGLFTHKVDGVCVWVRTTLRKQQRRHTPKLRSSITQSSN